VTLYYESDGDGAPAVFLHAGIADSRMWDPQWASFAGRYRLLRCDLSGYGRSPIERLPFTHGRDVIGLLEQLGVSSAVLVGASFGGGLALEIALARPDLVRALVLVAASLPDGEWGEAVRAYSAEEEEAVERGDLDAATESSLRMWVDGPRRGPADVDAGVRAAVGAMQRNALELQMPIWDEYDSEPLVEDVTPRLGEIAVPALVVVGDEDVEDIQVMARTLVHNLPGAQSATITGAAHLPSLERPAAFDELALAFLAGV
jgi:3-oxoadipate enol-lactonase